MTTEERVKRNQNPTPEAISAMWVYGKEYSQKGCGSMTFWDGLSDEQKDKSIRALKFAKSEVTRVLKELEQTIRVNNPKDDSGYSDACYDIVKQIEALKEQE